MMSVDQTNLKGAAEQARALMGGKQRGVEYIVPPPPPGGQNPL